MNLIVRKDLLAPKVARYVVRAPEIAQRRRPGQFVIVRPRRDSERIPLTIADSGADDITLVVQEVGKTTAVMADMEAGESLADVCGPLGEPTHIGKIGTVAVVGGGIGIAPSYPIARALSEAGNTVIAILGARTSELLIMVDEMRRASHETLIVTDDGSRGMRGFVTDALRALIEGRGRDDRGRDGYGRDDGGRDGHGRDGRACDGCERGGRRIDQVVAIGPAIMMKMVSEMTRSLAIPTLVSLNTIMIDGTGMCGGCRVSVGGRTRFVCVDGPEFDGHQVDFDQLIRRQAMYREQEKHSYEDYLAGRKLRLAASPPAPIAVGAQGKERDTAEPAAVAEAVTS